MVRPLFDSKIDELRAIASSGRPEDVARVLEELEHSKTLAARTLRQELLLRDGPVDAPGGDGGPPANLPGSRLATKERTADTGPRADGAPIDGGTFTSLRVHRLPSRPLQGHGLAAPPQP
jgi:hypothetical protein